MEKFGIRRGYCKITDDEFIMVKDFRTHLQNIFRYIPHLVLVILCGLALLAFFFFTSGQEVKSEVVDIFSLLIILLIIFAILTVVGDKVLDNQIPLSDISKVVFDKTSLRSSPKFIVHYSKDGKERKRPVGIGFQFGPVISDSDNIKTAFRDAGIPVEDE